MNTCLTRLMLLLIGAGVLSLIVFGRMLADKEVIDLDKINPQRFVNGPALVLSATVDRPAGLLIRTGKVGDNTLSLSYLDTADQTLRWSSAPLAGDSTPNALIVGDNAVFVAEGLRLRALALDDGDQQWAADLPAGIAARCDSCLNLAGESVVLLDETGVLHGFDALTGDLRWSAPLNTIPDRLLIVEGHPAVLDTLETGESALLLFDPLTGAVARRFDLRCGEETGSPQIVYTPFNAALYALFSRTVTGCAQRWDAATGDLVWETVPAVASWPHSWFDNEPLVANDTIYFGGDTPDDPTNGLILALDTGTGDVQEIIPRSSDYTPALLKPLAVEDDTLIVRAIPASGQDELWAMSTLGGERYWRYEFDPTGSSWAAQLTPGGLVIIQLLAGPDRIAVDILNPHTGMRLSHTFTEIGGAMWSGTTWTDTTAWLTVRRLYAVDLTSGAIVQFWPPPEKE